MKAVQSNYVKFLMFKCFNKGFVSIVYISFSPSVILPCDRSIESFVTNFPGSTIYNLLFQCPVTSCFLRSFTKCSLYISAFPSFVNFILFLSISVSVCRFYTRCDQSSQPVYVLLQEGCFFPPCFRIILLNPLEDQFI